MFGKLEDIGTIYRRGLKEYELTNHLENVLAVVSDRAVPVPGFINATYDHYLPAILNTTDYYPFGSTLKERSSRWVYLNGNTLPSFINQTQNPTARKIPPPIFN